MFSPLAESMFIMPVCYHPTTVLAVDDDINFLNNLSIKVSNTLALLCFDKPANAIEYTKFKHKYLPFTSRCQQGVNTNVSSSLNFLALRNEMYNKDRFREIFIKVTDYDMPLLDGIELVNTMEFPQEISQYSHIFLTGKMSNEFKGKLSHLGLKEEYVGKDDPDYVNSLLNLIDVRLAKIFQYYSYIPARLLSQDPREHTAFLFDGNFAPQFNAYLKDNSICEFYLFDKQGSYVFFDNKANPSWLFVRNEQGIKNTIQLATEYGAPKSIIEALKEKKVILSLYEREDFANRNAIKWDEYLLPANVFESDETYLSFFPGLIPDLANGKHEIPRYYYAFSTEFPEHGIDKSKILSYEAFLENE